MKELKELKEKEKLNSDSNCNSNSAPKNVYHTVASSSTASTPSTSSPASTLPMIYLDNAATSFPKPERVYDAMDRFARTQLGNPGRGSHRMAMGSDRVLHDG